MTLSLGVLLLYCKEGRQTRFSRTWAERAVSRTAEYLAAQSGGREAITFKVYDWVNLDPLTEMQWSGLGFGAFDNLRSTIEEKLNEQEGALLAHDHILIGIDHSTSGGGTTAGKLTYLAATNFTPSLIAHELGHRFGAADAYRESPEGPIIYENAFCVMGGKSWPATFADDTLADRDAPMLNQTGPGMSAPTLLGTGWLKEGEHEVTIDLTQHNLSTGGGLVKEISALNGAPGPGWSRPPVMIRYQDLTIEYRIADGWDRGLLNPGTNAGGWLVVHRSQPDAPAAVFVKRLAAQPGAMLLLGEDNPLDLFKPGPLKLSVLSFDAAGRSVRLHLSRRAAKSPASGETFGGVDVGGDGLVWTPGRGFTPVPPHSPLVQVLDHVAEIHALEQMLAVAAEQEVLSLSRATAQSLRTLQKRVDELRVEPALSPLAHALDTISQLHETSERLETGSGDEATRVFLETSRRQLRDIKQILASAVEQQGRL